MSADALLEMRGVRKQYGKGALALDGIDLTIRKGTTVAVVGPSGAGKSTLARCLAGFDTFDSGTISFAGHDPAKVQMIFQDPDASLNPRWTAREIVEEPLFIRGVPASDRRLQALTLMSATGLLESWAERKPRQFSGGQKARLAIARALAADPNLLILDETLSGLDLSVRAHILNLLNSLQRERGLAYLLITHDRSLAEYFASETWVLRAGRIATFSRITCSSAT